MPGALYQLGWECMHIEKGVTAARPDARVEFPGVTGGAAPFGVVEHGRVRVYIGRVGENRLVAWVEGRGRPPADQAVEAEELPKWILALLGPTLIWDAGGE